MEEDILCGDTNYLQNLYYSLQLEFAS